MNVSTKTYPRSEPDAEVGFSLERQPPVLFINEAALCEWVASAQPGASTVYFRGHLASGRTPSAGALGEPERKRLVAAARRALQLGEDGLVHLVQRRHGPGDYSYTAVKAHVRRPGHSTPAGPGVAR
jgi:hypothetical protein